MHSIRLSLVVYFLLLLTGALSAVSWLVYETASKTLHEKEMNARQRWWAECQSDSAEAIAEMERRLLNQAQTLASMTCISSTHFESLYPLGLLGSGPMPQGHLLVPLWVAQGTRWEFSAHLFRLRKPNFQVENAEALIPNPDKDQPQEYFQIFRDTGHNVLQSESMELEGPLDLDDRNLKEAEFYKGFFDQAELASGVPVRRVTMKASVTRSRSSTLNFSWRLVSARTKFGPTTPKKMSFPALPRPGFGRPPFGPPPARFIETAKDAPSIFVQYASETNLLDDRIRGLERTRDRRLDLLQHETQAALANLRQRLWLICLATFVGILAGGFFLVHLGLAPLHRLSAAVSQVSARDFRLKVDQSKLPHELKSIAARLAETLELLGKAFAREKQAAANISHELRTPLSALLATVDLALRRDRSAGEYREFFQDCHGSGRQMMHLVERLLALARLDAGADCLRPRAIDVADLANQCADLVRPLAQARGLVLRVHAEPPLPLQADPDKLREVLTNLLHNAIEYNNPQGSIELTVRRDNGHLHMQVRDTGIGITPHARDHIFERFYRADPSRHSDDPHAGLGLSIVKSCVDLMGGRIDVHSDATGSTFRVQVPASDGLS